MCKRTLFLIALSLLTLWGNWPFIPSVQASQKEFVEAKVMDKRARVLKAYLAKRNSPLQYHAQDFVDAADTYQLDWKLVAAISGVESTFGKFVPGGTDPQYTSYNAWGWGVYGTQAIYFKSWREGIFAVSKGLRTGYFNKGLTDPYSINRVYAASPTWGAKVSFFLGDMQRFEAGYKDEISLLPNLVFQTAGSSALIASR